jgi:hypothetical protein
MIRKNCGKTRLRFEPSRQSAFLFPDVTRHWGALWDDTGPSRHQPNRRIVMTSALAAATNTTHVAPLVHVAVEQVATSAGCFSLFLPSDRRRGEARGETIRNVKKTSDINITRRTPLPPIIQLTYCYSFIILVSGATSRRSVSVHRQGELKRGTVGHICRGPEAATMGLHDRTADGEPHTHAAGFGGEEGGEQPIRILG